MLTRTPGWTTTSGKHFTELKDAQADELHEILLPFKDGALPLLVEAILKESDKFVDILTMTATSKPRARSVNGGKKTRKVKATAQPEPQPTPA